MQDPMVNKAWVVPGTLVVIYDFYNDNKTVIF